MKRLGIYLLSLVLFVVVATSQSYTFRVLANKGQSKVKMISGQEVSLKTGATLKSSDVLIVGSDSYIGLMHNSGKTIELRKSGKFTMSDLENNIKRGTTSVASRYAKFVSDKMNETETGDYKRNMNVTGAVSRGPNGSISFMLDGESPEFLGNIAVIRWNPILDANGEVVEGVNYTFKIKNIFDVEVMNVKTDKSSVVLDFTKTELQNEEGLYIIEVSKTDDNEYSSIPIGLRMKKGGDANEIMTDYQNLKSEVSEDSPLSKLIFASFFEEKGLLLDALTQYEEVIKMYPDVIDFQELYKNFLITNALSKE